MKTNAFIAAALEEIEQEVSTTQVVPVDAVAELAKTNLDLAAENSWLEEEKQQSEENEVVAAGVTVCDDLEELEITALALEELVELANLTASKGQANQASVAALAFGLEQITNSIGLKSILPALEADSTPAEQATSIGDTAKKKSQEIMKRIIEGLRYVFKIVMDFFSKIFTYNGRMVKKLESLKKSLENGSISLDGAQSFTNDEFLESLRSPDTHDSIAKQFAVYAEFARNAIVMFGSRDYEEVVKSIYESVNPNSSVPDEVRVGYVTELFKLVELANEHIFTEKHAWGSTVEVFASNNPKNRNTYTKAMIGELCLHMEVNADTDPIIARVDNSRASYVFKARETGGIDPISKQEAISLLSDYIKILNKQTELDAAWSRVYKYSQGFEIKSSYTSITFNSSLLKLYSGMSVRVLSEVLRTNMKNAQKLMAYIELSSKAAKK